MVTPQGGVIKATKAVVMFQTLGVQNDSVLKDNTEVVDIKKDQSTEESPSQFNQWKLSPITGRLTKSMKINTIENGFPNFASHGDPPIYGTPSFEFPGLIKIPINDGSACEPEERTWEAPPDMWIHCANVLETIRGLVDNNGLITQSCMHSMTPDKDYVIDFLGGEFGENAVVAGGFFGHGFKMAPVVGRILAELVASGTTEGINLTHFMIAKFEKNLRGNYPLPNVNKAYSMVLWVERQRQVNLGMVEAGDSSALLGKLYDNRYGSGPKNNLRRKGPFDKRHLNCDHCHKTGHTKENCFKLHVAPDWYKDLTDQRKRSGNGGRIYVATEDTGNSTT
ncbi:UNVERIFIED_CONTAM: putative sarcosine oxidase [Sesamum latifolium]|uniref:Sarcosine oxidase n=1 Tax=Sesamum latifolium TaxID=2727402 RepID=A0AAW2YAZ6_9LAMI